MNDVQTIKSNNGASLGARGTIKHIYFIGIGGIGMSALARYYYTQGATVSGYDKTPTPLTEALEKTGISIQYNEDLSLIPRDVQLVVYTPAVPSTHAALQYYRNHGYTVVKRSDVLQMITESSFNVAVAGTHGKTTVSTMIAHILRDSDFGCNAFLGGISANYQTNFWSSENNVCVIEADEYDRSFLKLSPNIAVITAMDADHLDIYGTAESLENAFIEFSGKIKTGGLLISKHGLQRNEALVAHQHITYHFDDEAADVFTSELRIKNGMYVFNVVAKEWLLTDVTLHMGGLHNIENAVAAVTVAKHLQISEAKIKEAIANFKGVKRRFEYILKEEEHVLIDDYAHHPEELKALISGVKSLFTGRLVVVFQPHLFSRTKHLAEDFARVLSTADEVILLPIYPARELPMEGVSSDMIMELMSMKETKVLEKEAMLQYIKQSQPGLLVMAGAGDIDALVNPVKELLTAQ